jgi:hypothetical protein
MEKTVKVNTHIVFQAQLFKIRGVLYALLFPLPSSKQADSVRI